MNHIEFFHAVESELDLVCKSANYGLPPTVPDELVFNPSELMHLISHENAVIFGDEEYHVIFVSDMGSTPYDGGELYKTFAVFGPDGFMFYFQISGTFSYWGDNYFDGPNDWEIVKPQKVVTYEWVS
jgi:hypothetical protein